MCGELHQKKKHNTAERISDRGNEDPVVQRSKAYQNKGAPKTMSGK